MLGEESGFGGIAGWMGRRLCLDGLRSVLRRLLRSSRRRVVGRACLRRYSCVLSCPPVKWIKSARGKERYISRGRRNLC